VADADTWNPCSSDATTNYIVWDTGTLFLPVANIDGTPIIQTAAPATPVQGWYYWADNDTWDPASIPGTDDYKVYYNGSAYVAVQEIDGTIYLQSVPLTHATYASTGNISTSHLYGYKLDNSGQSSDAVETLPAAAANMNALYETVDTSNAYTIRPPSGGQLLFVDSTGAISQLAANEGVTCSAANAAIGEELRITTYQTGASTYAYKIVQTIGDGFAEETP
jgi:hypothetical protein